MPRGVNQEEQLAGERVEYQVEYRGSDLFRTAHTDLDSNLAINSAINLTGACVLAKREDCVAVPVPPFPEGGH